MLAVSAFSGECCQGHVTAGSCHLLKCSSVHECSYLVLAALFSEVFITGTISPLVTGLTRFSVSF